MSPKIWSPQLGRERKHQLLSHLRKEFQRRGNHLLQHVLSLCSDEVGKHFARTCTRTRLYMPTTNGYGKKSCFYRQSTPGQVAMDRGECRFLGHPWSYQPDVAPFLHRKKAVFWNPWRYSRSNSSIHGSPRLPSQCKYQTTSAIIKKKGNTIPFLRGTSWFYRYSYSPSWSEGRSSPRWP